MKYLLKNDTLNYNRKLSKFSC